MKRQEIIEWAKKIDKDYADLETRYGAFKEGKGWTINLWQPLAKEVVLLIFDKENQNNKIREVKGKFISPNWTWHIEEDLDGYFYQYKITQSDGSTNLALDPFAKSMAAFNWEGDEDKVAKAAFVDFTPTGSYHKLNECGSPHEIVYEAHVRDLTSLRSDVSIPGSFKALKEAKVAEHISDLGFTTIQFLPIHNCFTLNENDKTILGKGEGNGWVTNYNWGYDPHNYFSVNGWYSSNPENPYSRMNEFKETVEYFHKNNLNVIVDVVYNHLMTNNVLNNVFPHYYFRGGEDKENIVTPVSYPPLASDRLMCRRIIIESLEWFVKAYDVDGFRFDLSSFTDAVTMKELAKKLRAIKPNLILHGEAWNFTDLPKEETFIIGQNDNDIDFGYFNDVTRNAIRGEDDGDGFAPGIIAGNVQKEFDKFVVSQIGNIKGFDSFPNKVDGLESSLFTSSTANNLQYASCHDGHTLWDKINLTVDGDKTTKFEAMRQSVLLQTTAQGRLLFLAGAEMLYSKPNDPSGEEAHRFHHSDKAIDLFGLGKSYNENTYKTTDWSCGMRWNQLNGDIKTSIYDFMKQAFSIRKSNKAFNLMDKSDMEKSVRFEKIDKASGVIDLIISTEDNKFRVVHNFGNEDYNFEPQGKILINSKLSTQTIGKSEAHSSQIILLNE